MAWTLGRAGPILGQVAVTSPLAPVGDPLGAALHHLRMDGACYFRSELTEPWRLSLPAMGDCLWFHVVTSGRCWLAVPGEEPRLLQPGELALVPHGQGHDLWSAPGLPAPPAIQDIPHEFVSERYAVLRHDGGGAPASLVCGAVRFDHPTGYGLMALLPRLMVVADPAVESTLRLFAEEARVLLPGGETVITRLADVLVIQAIRSWLASAPEARAGWLGALRDPQVGRAVALVHREPARAWTVAGLASAVAMSRSAFAARFTELVGEPVMGYVTRWRMHVAAGRLRAGEVSVAEVARELGYRSEAAFSRAFKRVTGVSPGSVRRAGPPVGLLS